MLVTIIGCVLLVALIIVGFRVLYNPEFFAKVTLNSFQAPIFLQFRHICQFSFSAKCTLKQILISYQKT